MTLSREFRHQDFIEKAKQPRDADNDGFIYDGTPRQRPAPPKNLSHLGRARADKVVRSLNRSPRPGPESRLAPRARPGLNVDQDMGGSAERGMKLVKPRSRKALESNPKMAVAVVQELRRIAVRAENKADWIKKLREDEATLFADDPDFFSGKALLHQGSHAEEAMLRAKAKDALAAMQELNRKHSLGYGR